MATERSTERSEEMLWFALVQLITQLVIRYPDILERLKTTDWDSLILPSAEELERRKRLPQKGAS